jgi:predicted aldo/keto reductase-like oxidoreductase
VSRRALLGGIAAGFSASGGMGGQMADVPRRQLGSTGQTVSAIGLGGSHIGGQELTDDQAIRLIRRAIDNGITFMDNSWDYHGGQSEIRMGKALRDGYRQKVFLMTKVDGRTKAEANKQLDESLSRLGTDHLDLWQFHEVIRYEDPDRIFAQDGAIEAAVEARKKGKIRYIGFTGHKDPHIHLYMLAVADRSSFHFDTVQMPLNVMDAHYRSFGQMVVPEAVKRGIGILGMKSMGGGRILQSHTATPVECLHYAMNLPTSVVIRGIQSDRDLDQDLRAARDFRPMTQAQVSALLAKTATAAAHGEYEFYKTTASFDSTATHPQWLGGERNKVEQPTPK